MGNVRVPPRPEAPGLFEAAAREAEDAVRDDDLRGLVRYAWIDDAQAAEFWDRVMALFAEYSQLPRSVEGRRAHALLTAMYPTDRARLGAPGQSGEGLG
ncbi:hypothetical protein V1260_07440 [Brachybacterium sp. J144]|uniref:hypothetical protein n=1 Tax=Brachybacterium sp. J144 TaxID=3116487 RepID=UPI002E77E0F1|nr:hypothetical protein [Brachybacterium sp. J144]MEE1650625.1 hypothetical protein [Brachybacterium sp. J144]